MFHTGLWLLQTLTLFYVVIHIPVLNCQSVPTCYFCVNCPNVQEADEIELYQQKLVPGEFGFALSFSCATAIIIWDNAQIILRTSVTSETLLCFRESEAFEGCASNITYNNLVEVEELYQCLGISTYDFYVKEITYLSRNSVNLDAQGISLDYSYGRFPFDEPSQDRYAAVSLCVCNGDLCNDQTMAELETYGLVRPQAAPSITPLEPSIPSISVSKPKETRYRSFGIPLKSCYLTILIVISIQIHFMYVLSI